MIEFIKDDGGRSKYYPSKLKKEKTMIKRHRYKMKLTNWTDLPYEKSIFLGGCNQDFCNRYLLRDDGMVEVQNIFRFAKPSETQVMTCEEFDAWLERRK